MNDEPQGNLLVQLCCPLLQVFLAGWLAQVLCHDNSLRVVL